MLIRTLWKEWESGDLELLAAMDVETAELSGSWADRCDEARKRYSIGPEDTREAMIEIHYAEIAELFLTPTVKGTVREETRS